MTITAARVWIKRELLRGLPVYLFEVADIVPEGFIGAVKLMAKMQAEGLVRRDDSGQNVPRWEIGDKLRLLGS